MPSVSLIGLSQRAHAHRLIDQAPDGWVMKLGEETRRDAQNRKMWPMIADIKAQVPDMARFSNDDIKLRFLNALGVEMRWLPELEGGGMFPVGLKSSTLTVAQFALLIELLYKYGAERGVQWSEPRGD
jgi:hypothetical protein